MDPDVRPPAIPPDSIPPRIDRPAPAASPDNGRQVLSSLLDMALGSRNARTEAEALQLNFLPAKP